MKFLLLFSLLTLPVLISAQIEDTPPIDKTDLRSKYLHYRDRLTSWFVLVDGEDDGIGEFIPFETPASDPFYPLRGLYSKAGYSLPASEYLPTTQLPMGFWAYHEPYYCHHQDSNLRGKGEGVLKWGGDDIIELGYYMAVLATEYAVAAQRKDSLQMHTSKRELYLALQSYRRLDMTANRWMQHWNETHRPNCKWEPDLSGFSGMALRNDVYPTIWKRFLFGHAKGILSQYIGCEVPDSRDYDIEFPRLLLSQDQVIGLLLGLQSIQKFVPKEVTYKGVSLKKRAARIGACLLNLVQPRKVKLPPCSRKTLSNWEGGQLQFLYHGIAQVVNQVAGERLRRSDFLDVFYWDLLELNCLNGKNGAPCLLGGAHYDNFIMFMKLCAVGDLKRLDAVQRACADVFDYNAGFFPILQSLLHDYPLSDLNPAFQERLLQLLVLAPTDGPCTPNNNPEAKDAMDCQAHELWQSERRFDRAELHRGVITNSYKNGMGYLLLYNLYQLRYGLLAE